MKYKIELAATANADIRRQGQMCVIPPATN